MSQSSAPTPPYPNFPQSLWAKKKKFRVCYYDPTTNSRSALSSEVIVVGQGRFVGDRIRTMDPHFARHSQSVWIE